MPIPAPWSVALLPITVLKPHEDVDEDHLRSLLREILRDGIIRKPILVESRNLIILDGHHRVEILRRLGGRVVPALIVDYGSERVIVSSWRNGVRVTKEDVLRAGLTGRRMPFKTSRHILVGVEIPEVDVPLRDLEVRIHAISRKG